MRFYSGRPTLFWSALDPASLLLGVTDDDRSDNSGAFNVVVRYAR